MGRILWPPACVVCQTSPVLFIITTLLIPSVYGSGFNGAPHLSCSSEQKDNVGTIGMHYRVCNVEVVPVGLLIKRCVTDVRQCNIPTAKQT